jgi:apolipoprotein N-acyltransferase
MQKLSALLDRYPLWLVLLAGGVSATGFAPLNLWPLTLLSLALLMHLIANAERGKRALLIGWLFGLGHFTIGNNWIATAFTYQANMPAWLGWLAVLLLALYLGVYPGLAAWGAWWIKRRATPDVCRATLSFILAFAGCWIIAEWLRSWVFTGFAWNPLGAIMLRDFITPPFIRWLGSYGLSGWVVLTVGLFIWTWQHLQNRWKNNGGGYGWLLVWLFAALLWLSPQMLIDTLSKTEHGARPAVELTIVQPNLSQIDKYKPGYEAINFSRLAQHSRPRDSQPRLLLWTESAIPWWLEDGYPSHAYWNQPGGTAAGTRATVARLLGPNDVLLTGADRLEFDNSGEITGARNAVLAMDAKGNLKGDYAKAHLVPFGEYLALRWLLEPLGLARLVPGDIDFLPGPGPETMRVMVNDKPIKVGMQICYEIIFSGQVTDRANRPDFIFNPSNDAWFGSWGPPQHLAQARLRAIEEGLPIARVTPTGISAVVDGDGRVLESLPIGKAGRIDVALPRAKAPTLFARYGNVLPLGFAMFLIALAFLPLVSGRISR